MVDLYGYMVVQVNVMTFISSIVIDSLSIANPFGKVHNFIEKVTQNHRFAPN